MKNIMDLRGELSGGMYRHGGYEQFRINDPKPRIIHKASVRDRLVHHALHRKLYSIFDKMFICDSYSCRIGKGGHKAIARFRKLARVLSSNGTKTVWVLKCDIRKFFDSVDHVTLKDLLGRSIPDLNVHWLLGNIIDSFQTVPGKGLPLGNLTSQLLVNIYMNEFDQWMKRGLRVRRYLRCADDFLILSRDRKELQGFIPHIRRFLEEKLKLALHPRKVTIQTFASGIDFLGWVHFPSHSVLRTSTKRRMMRTIRAKPESAVLQSYRSLLKHGSTFKLGQEMENIYGLLRNQAQYGEGL